MITRRREEPIVTAGRSMRMGAMQIGDAIVAAMPDIPAATLVRAARRLIVIKSRIVVLPIVRPSLLGRFGLDRRDVLPGTRILCLADEGTHSGEPEGGQKQRSDS
jgi:hypothetical protein